MQPSPIGNTSSEPMRTVFTTMDRYRSGDLLADEIDLAYPFDVTVVEVSRVYQVEQVEQKHA